MHARTRRAYAATLAGRISSQHRPEHTQHPGWADQKWRYAGSIFEGFQVEPAGPVGPINRVVVTLGTMRAYAFTRALERVAEVLPEVAAPDVEIMWQVGATPFDGLVVNGRPIEGRVSVPPAELHAAIEQADLVIAHAGIGSALAALNAGHCPILLPRRSALGEHVDDHQIGIAAHLGDRRLAVSMRPENLTAAHVLEARTRRIAQTMDQTRFLLADATFQGNLH